jgi:hypothetical protein
MLLLRRTWLFLLILFSFPFYQIQAFDTYVIHPKLAGIIASLYNEHYSKQALSAQEIEWLTQGTIEEDEPISRAFNHFYNPLTGKGLKIAGITLGLPSPRWAYDVKEQAASAGGDCSWSSAIQAYKNNDKDRAFRCLGHTLHLLEDVGVPAHTRNDQHAFGDPFEEWAKYNNPDISLDQNLFDPSCQRANDCIIELATWININFFSKNTISDKNFPSPMNRGLLEGIYLRDSDRILAIYNSKNKSYSLTQEIQSAYWQEISPMIIAYGHRLIEIFFSEVGVVEEIESLSSEEILDDNLPQSSLQSTSLNLTSPKPLSLNSSTNKNTIESSEKASENIEKPKAVSEILKPITEIISNALPETIISQTANQVLPDTYILTRPASLINQTNADFVFSSDISNVNFQCSSNNINWISCASTHHLANLSEGKNEIFVRAVSVAGPDASPIHYIWTVDTIAPVTAFLPSIGLNSRTATFRFYSEIGAYFECRFDNSDWRACESPKVYEDISSGNHSFHVRAFDKVGNREVVPSGHIWQTVIAKPASPTLIFPTSSPFYTNDPNLQIIAETPTDTTLLINNSSEYIAQTSNQWISERELVEGENIFQLTSNNSYNEQSDPIEIIINKDSSVPSASIENLPEYYEQSEFFVNWRGFDNNSSNLYFDVDYKIAEEGWQTWKSNTREFQGNFTVLNLGQDISFRVRAIDQSGNISEWSEISTIHYAVTPVAHLVISQLVANGVLGSGDEFIELYNPSASALALNGYKLQKKSQAGIIWLDVGGLSVFQNIVIPARGYILISGNDYSYQVDSDIRISEELAYDINGHIRIIDEDSEEVDRLGYGSASSPEGLAAPTLNQGFSLQRKAQYSSTALSLQNYPFQGNSYDSDYNLFDFVLQNIVVPRASHNQPITTNNLEEGLQNIWHFDECNGDTFDSINTSSPYHTVNWVVGKYGCGLTQSWYTQDQVSWDLVRPIITSEVTISFYMQQSAYGSAGNIWFLNSESNAGVGIKISAYGTSPLFNSEEIVLNTPLPSTGDWHNISLVYSRNYLGYYVDGILKKKILGDYRLNQSLYKLIIGQASYPWKFDEIAVWDRALSSEEIAASLNDQLSPHILRPPQSLAHLVHFWNFDNETSVIDSINGAQINDPEIIPGRLGEGLHISWQRTLPDATISNIVSKDVSISYWRKKGLIGNGGGAVLITNHQTGRRFGMGGGYGESYYHFNESVEALGCYIPADDDWHHITLVYDSYLYQIRYYIDGILESVREQVWFWGGFDRLVVGEQQYSFIIDDLKIWEGALTNQQVSQEAQLVIP